MEVTELSVGQEVRVYEPNFRYGKEPTEYVGHVVKVARVFVTISYDRHGREVEAKCRIDYQHVPGAYSSSIYFLTLDQVDKEQRLKAAMAVLKAHHVEMELGYRLDLDTAERVARALEGA